MGVPVAACRLPQLSITGPVPVVFCHSTRCISRGSRHASNLPSVTTFVKFGACHLFMSREDGPTTWSGEYASPSRQTEETKKRFLTPCPVAIRYSVPDPTAQEKSLLSAWPLPRRPGWIDHVNTPQTDAELGALRRSVQRGCPYGDSTWSEKMVQQLSLESTLRPHGRPKKQHNGS